jgi:hypothetical protein
VIVECKAYGLSQLVGRKLHQFAGGQRDGRQAQHRHVPAARAHAHIESIDQPTIDFVGKHDRGDQFRGTRMLRLGDRETGRDVIARMTGDAADIGVIQVEITKCGAIGESREIRRGLPRGADDGRSAMSAVRQRDVTPDADGLIMECGEAATDSIDEMDFDALDRRLVEVLIAQVSSIGGQPVREGAGRGRWRRCLIFRSRDAGSDRKCGRSGYDLQYLSSRHLHRGSPPAP